MPVKSLPVFIHVSQKTPEEILEYTSLLSYALFRGCRFPVFTSVARRDVLCVKNKDRYDPSVIFLKTHLFRQKNMFLDYHFSLFIFHPTFFNKDYVIALT